MAARGPKEYMQIDTGAQPPARPSKMRANIIFGLLGFFVLTVVLVVLNSSGSSGDVADTGSWVWVEDPLVKTAVSNSSLVCNDGSPAYWYWRPGASDKWVIYFEGTQTYCFDEVSCQARWDASPTQMSSTEWEDEQYWGGILSTNPDINPDWYDANHVDIRHCTSDFYSGQAYSTDIGYSFLGWDIVSQIITDLIEDYDLLDASKVTVTGNGGGGVGVLLFVDRIADALQDTDAVVKGLADAAIMVDYEAYTPRDPEEECTEASKCDLHEALPIGVDLWNAALPYRCSKEGFTWECFVAEYTADLLDTDTFWYQWLYESAQLTSLNVPLGFPDLENDNITSYLEEIAVYYQDVIHNNNIESYFLPRCWAHEVIMSDKWADVIVGGMNGPEAFEAFWNGEDAAFDDDCDSINCNPTC